MRFPGSVRCTWSSPWCRCICLLPTSLAEQRHALVNLNSAILLRPCWPAQCRRAEFYRPCPNLSARSSTECFHIFYTIVPKRNQRIKVTKDRYNFRRFSGERFLNFFLPFFYLTFQLLFRSISSALSIKGHNLRRNVIRPVSGKLHYSNVSQIPLSHPILKTVSIFASFPANESLIYRC